MKAIAKWLGFEWRNLEANGAQSLVWYAQWQSSRKGQPLVEGDHTLLETILIYNEDDCLATYRLKTWLAQLQAE